MAAGARRALRRASLSLAAVTGLVVPAELETPAQLCLSSPAAAWTAAMSP